MQGIRRHRLEFCLARAPFATSRPAGLGTSRCPCLDWWMASVAASKRGASISSIVLEIPTMILPLFWAPCRWDLLFVFWVVCVVLLMIRSRGMQLRRSFFWRCWRSLLVARSFTLQMRRCTLCRAEVLVRRALGSHIVCAYNSTP